MKRSTENQIICLLIKISNLVSQNIQSIVSQNNPGETRYDAYQNIRKPETKGGCAGYRSAITVNHLPTGIAGPVIQDTAPLGMDVQRGPVESEKTNGCSNNRPPPGRSPWFWLARNRNPTLIPTLNPAYFYFY